MEENEADKEKEHDTEALVREGSVAMWNGFVRATTSTCSSAPRFIVVLCMLKWYLNIDQKKH